LHAWDLSYERRLARAGANAASTDVFARCASAFANVLTAMPKATATIAARSYPAARKLSTSAAQSCQSGIGHRTPGADGFDDVRIGAKLEGQGGMHRH
jgi:hypothetical protein